ncbi:hypothetical protein [Limoniibacter endophyticus]|uniref:Uncharacterized protein n=1 Tax=Limoniibacter endophyticus TaxID=1565040 RepID=A0A8J3GG45_9HYPH|nr:hypothetical protein [Limoniibacter endophyticus]GHC66708.1 hypothetical protein GCM10010136_10020 [Limoniibacter endophyticus]
MSTLVAIETLGREIKARVEAGDKALDKAEQHYKAAGIQLLEVHKRLKETREMRWSAFLFSHARMGRSRAHELMALGDGRTTLEDIRAKGAERARRHAERNRDARLSVSNVEKTSAAKSLSVETIASPNENDLEDIRRENERLKREIAELREKHKDKVKELKSVIEARDDMVKIAERQSQEAHTRAMFAEADKERLTQQVETAREDGMNRLEEMLLNEYYSAESSLRDLFRTKELADWQEESIEKFTSEAITFADIMLMVSEAGFSRLSDFHTHCSNVGSIPEYSLPVREKSWIRHARQLQEPKQAA